MINAPLHTNGLLHPKALAVYRFDDGVTSTAKDYSRNGHNLTTSGTLATTPSTKQGRYGIGTFMSGQLPLTTALRTALLSCSEYTIMFWINQISNATANQYMFAQQNGMLIQMGSNNSTNFSFRFDGENPTTSGIYFDLGNITGTWTHIACTSKGGNQRKVYVNGILRASDTRTGTFGSSSTAAKIGQFYNVATQLNGYIDDFQIIKSALTPPFYR